MASLREKLDDAELRSIAWESMVEVADEMGYPVKQKPWDEVLENAKKKHTKMQKKDKA